MVFPFSVLDLCVLYSIDLIVQMWREA